jgi:AraC-like DNA-binding protein
MKPDSGRAVSAAAARPERLDLIERAHLKEAGDRSHVMHRYEPSAEFDGFLQRFWIPVWSVPPAEEAPQRVLQYPVCLLVITGGYARFYGVVSGLSTTRLTGDGWAVGVMLAPAAGALIARRSVAAYTDTFVDLAEVLGGDGSRLVQRVREAMAPDPRSADAHHAAMTSYADALRPLLPVDQEGLLVNRLVGFVEQNRDVLRVSQVCEAFGLTERGLQRLVHRRLGLTPKWLIQRRRLQEAAEELRRLSTTSGQVAAQLGYADQAHFIRDFSRVTAMTPGQFAARHASGRP